jgi:hypothetical protein
MALRPVLEKNRIYGAEGFHKTDLSRRAVQRLRDASKTRLLALPHVDLPEYDLIDFLARALDNGGTLETLLHGRPDLARATS